MRTIRDYETIELKRNRNVYETSLPQERKFPTNPREEAIRNEFPETCTPDCKHIQCPFRRTENYGKPCLQQWNIWESEKWKKTAPKNVNEELLRNLGSDEPVYKSPLSSSNKPIHEMKPTSLIKRKSERSLQP